MKLSITEMDINDRPREKMMRLGASGMTDAELLAILIGSGNTEENAVALMQRMLAECKGDLNQLGKWGIEDFSRYRGMGPAKSLTVMAALELGKRRQLQEHTQRPVIRTSRDAYDVLHPILCDMHTEEVWVILLGPTARVIDRVRVSQGGIDHALADVRTILREALIHHATQIVLAHNHPSGDTRPSTSDKRMTDEVKRAAEYMHIHLLDHVIIGDGSYFSFNDEGIL